MTTFSDFTLSWSFLNANIINIKLVPETAFRYKKQCYTLMECKYVHTDLIYIQIKIIYYGPIEMGNKRYLVQPEASLACIASFIKRSALRAQIH